MFEDEKDDKIYNLLISRGIDENNEFKTFCEKLYSKNEFLWTESFTSSIESAGDSFFKNVDAVIILSGIYTKNKVAFDLMIDKAMVYQLPIILVRPYGEENVPENLEKIVDDVVGWNANCIIETIKDLVTGEESESCHLD
ncbi:MAG: nuclease [Methanobrevibacter sp.]|jgi:hypothetical protein|nr:nuclease [Methanobrevibacter sp.]